MKMKTSKTLKIFTYFILIISTFSSCVQDNQYATPTIKCEEPQITTTNTIAQIKAMYLGTIKEFTSDLIISGYVVSSDKSGNIYKTISIQDAPENPTSAISITIDQTDTYTKYNIGRKIYIKLNGLAIDKNGGVLQIGKAVGASLARIPSLEVADHISRSCETAEIVPKKITFAQINDGFVDMLIQLDGMQFRSSDFGLSYANTDNNYSVNRIVESYDDNCLKLGEIIMRNSGFANFKDVALPQGKGTLTGVLSKYNSTYQLFIRDTNDVDFTNPNCVPFFEETFATQVPGADINLPNWTNYKQAGSLDWKAYSDSNSLGVSANFSAFGTNDSSNIGWLITPPINMDLHDSEKLSFQTSNSYADSSILEVLISTDWDGNESTITSSTWQVLPATIVTPSDYYKDWINSGSIDLSSYTGTAYIAFRYTGAGNNSSMNGTYELDNIKINAN